jgi:hypothetical protein
MANIFKFETTGDITDHVLVKDCRIRNLINGTRTAIVRVYGLSVVGLYFTGTPFTITDTRTNTKLFHGQNKENKGEVIRPGVVMGTWQMQDDSVELFYGSLGLNFDYSAGVKSEKTILQETLGVYSTIIVGDHVISGTNPSITFSGCTCRRILEELANQCGRHWFVDDDHELHYFSTYDTAAPFGLSDNPDNSTTYKYGKLAYRVARENYVEVEGGSLVCWQPGLVVGQLLSITNADLSWAARTFTINEIDIEIVGGDLQNTATIEYTVRFGTLTEPRLSDYTARSNMRVSQADSGLLPLLENDTTKYLRSDGIYAAPAGGMTDPLTERGSIIYRGASAPAELKHGDTGKYLETQGDGADPTWSYSTSHTTMSANLGGVGQHISGGDNTNSTGKTLVVMVTAAWGDSPHTLSAYVGASSPSQLVGQGYDYSAYAQVCLTFVVPPGYHYGVLKDGGTPTLVWTEWIIG